MRLECSDTSQVSGLHNSTNILTNLGSSRTVNWAYISCRVWASSIVNNDLLQLIKPDHVIHRAELWVLQNCVLLIPKVWYLNPAMESSQYPGTFFILCRHAGRLQQTRNQKLTQRQRSWVTHRLEIGENCCNSPIMEQLVIGGCKLRTPLKKLKHPFQLADQRQDHEISLRIWITNFIVTCLLMILAIIARQVWTL